jgi:hypothetical protein
MYLLPYLNMYQKITITLPTYIVQDLNKKVKKGAKSNFIYEAIREKLLDQQVALKNIVDPIDEAYEYSKTLPKLSTTKLIKAIKKGRK